MSVASALQDLQQVCLFFQRRQGQAVQVVQVHLPVGAQRMIEQQDHTLQPSFFAHLRKLAKLHLQRLRKGRTNVSPCSSTSTRLKRLRTA